MSVRTAAIGQKSSMQSSQSGGILQRTCACGNHTHGAGECESCRKKRTNLQRFHYGHERDMAGQSVPPIVHEVLRSPGQRLDSQARGFMEKHFGHDFRGVHVHTDAKAAKSASYTETTNSFGDIEDDPMHRPLVEQFRQREHLPPGGRDEMGTPVGPSEAEIKYGGLLMPCPSSTEVANTIDMRNDALTAGFRTAYGIHSQMRVRPDGRTWDGVQISESLTAGTNSCPDTLTRGEPCSGASTFTVGAASGNSSVLAGPRPGTRNRFWDFHTTHVKPRGVSVLHDATRNPANLNTCSTVCNQEYRCNGNLIGSHTITRTFHKGTYNGQNITFVDVTKR